jgi:glycosyltransferase involved in cell wall biosynthesis
MTRDIKIMRKIIKEHQINCKIISVLHFNPGYEEFKITWKKAFQSFNRSNRISEIIKGCIRIGFFPLYKIFYPLRNKELYKTVYEYSDKVVLLSNRFVNEYRDYAKIKDEVKFETIPNALSFDFYYNTENLSAKKKQVLIVSRLDEIQKRISLSIQIWAALEKNTELTDWHLKIVGHGEAETDYKKMVKDLGLKRISFEGRQNPLNYYKESSIFMMTSAYEGLGLTLTEAQQMGCIPIAFDSYSSVFDIIENGKNGYIIKNNNLEDYICKMKSLMTNKNLRNNMAHQAILSSKRYELPQIIDNWEHIICKYDY